MSFELFDKVGVYSGRDTYVSLLRPGSVAFSARLARQIADTRRYAYFMFDREARRIRVVFTDGLFDDRPQSKVSRGDGGVKVAAGAFLRCYDISTPVYKIPAAITTDEIADTIEFDAPTEASKPRGERRDRRQETETPGPRRTR